MKRMISAALVMAACVPMFAQEVDYSSLMHGFPPAKEQRVTRQNFMLAPYNRWAFQHMRELQPTREVYRGSGAVSAIEQNALDLADRPYRVSGGRSIALEQWLDESATDAFLVMHKGKLIYEHYQNSQQRHTQHQMFSATKSFVGTLVLMLIEEGLIEPQSALKNYIPELGSSAFGDATVQQVLNMTTSIQFSEVYTDPDADIWAYGYVFGLSDVEVERREESIYDYLPTLGKMQGYQHGEAFHYVTPNTDVLGWLLSRVSGQSLSALLAERFWQPMGMLRDGYVWLDRSGTEMAGGGLNMTARDAARFGQMVLQGGEYNGDQILSPAIARRILTPGDPETFTVLHDDPWYTEIAHSYHDQWWSFNNPHNAVSAIGVHGQFIYIDPVAEMVVVKQSSHAEAEGISNEVDGPLVWHAIAERLLAEEAPAKT